MIARFARGEGGCAVRDARFARGKAPFGRRNGGRVLLMAVLLGLVGGAPGLTAQDPVPAELSFDEAVRVALDRNPAFLRQANDVDAAEYGERQSLGQAFLPSLSASLGFGGGWSRNRTGEDDFGQPTEASDFLETTQSSASQGVNASVPIFSIESIRSYAAARDETAARAAGVDYQAALLRTQVGQAYFGAVQRDQLIGVEERNLETARQSLAAIEQLLRVAARQPTDVLGAELQVAQAEQALAEARGAALKARLELAARMGVDLERSFDLTTAFAAVFDPADLAAEALIQRALEGSPRIAEQAANVEAARTGLSAARASRYPSLSGNLSYGRSVGMQGYDALGRFDLPNQGWNFGLSVSLPVFSQFGTAARIGQADLAVQDADESLREARLQLEVDVRSALIDLQNAYTGVLVAQRQVEIGRERLEQGQQLYRLGNVDFTELQTMIDQLSNYERSLINARFNFTDALLQLEEKVGGPVRQ